MMPIGSLCSGSRIPENFHLVGLAACARSQRSIARSQSWYATFLNSKSRAQVGAWSRLRLATISATFLCLTFLCLTMSPSPVGTTATDLTQFLAITPESVSPLPLSGLPSAVMSRCAPRSDLRRRCRRRCRRRALPLLPSSQAVWRCVG